MTPTVRVAFRVGRKTLAVTIPSDWAERVGVAAGTLLEVADVPGGFLRVAPAGDGARASFVGERSTATVPCPSCGAAVGIGTRIRRPSFRAKFRPHAAEVHADLGDEGMRRLADRFAEEAVRAARGARP